MTKEIRSKKELEQFLEKNNDYNPEINYLSKNKGGECFVIFGCTHATEAFDVAIKSGSLVITTEYNKEIEAQKNSDFPEFEGFFIKS